VTSEWGPVRLISNLIWLPIILASTFVGGPPVEHPGWAVVTAVVAGAGWVVTGLHLEHPAWIQPAGIVVTGAGGVVFVAAVGGWSTPLAFCIYAVLCAGARLPATASVAVLVGVTMGAVAVLRDESASGLMVLVLGLTAVLLFGMGRRESTKRAEQRDLTLVASARIHEEHAKAAALAERARIARDVHDVLAHSLSALAVQLQGARLMLQRDGAPPDTLAQVERAQRLATDGLAEARRAVHALRTEPVDLADGLRALVADTPEATLQIDGDPGVMAAAAQETLLRTAQEALSNVRKHAAGAPVSVRLSHRDGATELEIHDHAGAPPPRAPGGYGLVGMAERAALAGGELDAGPVEDGWRVLLRLPATEAPGAPA
jgi:signal transduction histidine kinase